MKNNNNDTHPVTLAVHRAQKDASIKARLKALSWLKVTFPEAFDTETQIRPLKIGIMEDILAYYDELEQKPTSKSKLREAVVMFSRRMDYLACVKVRDHRIDLHGNVVAPVSEEHARIAAETIRAQVERSIVSEREEVVEEPETCDEPVVTLDIKKPTPAVTIKRKASKQFDPEVVARLKAKLGIAKRGSSTPA